MKITWLLSFLIISNFCLSQETVNDKNIYEGILSELFVNHQPSAKGDAMGRGLVANNDGDFGAYYNPALTSLSEGLKFNYSYSQSEPDKPSFNYYEVSYTNEKLGSIGLSAHYYSKNPYWYSYYNASKKSYYDAAYTINYSREVIKDFYAGLNLGIYHYTQYFDNFNGDVYLIYDDGLTMDLGLLKKFHLYNKSDKHVFEIGAALYNITNSKYSRNFGDYLLEKSPLPVTFRIGGSHQLKMIRTGNYGDYTPVQLFTHIEFEKIINSELDAVFKIGEEITIMDIVILRGGYFYSKVTEKRYPDDNYYFQSEFTAGAGLNIPINKLFKFKTPLNLKLDYTSKDLETRERFDNNYGTFYTFGVTLNYVP